VDRASPPPSRCPYSPCLFCTRRRFDGRRLSGNSGICGLSGTLATLRGVKRPIIPGVRNCRRIGMKSPQRSQSSVGTGTCIPRQRPAQVADDNDSDYSCRAAQNMCRDGMSMCAEYRQDFIRAGRVCPGVTDIAIPTSFSNPTMLRPLCSRRLRSARKLCASGQCRTISNKAAAR